MFLFQPGPELWCKRRGGRRGHESNAKASGQDSAFEDSRAARAAIEADEPVGGANDAIAPASRRVSECVLSLAALLLLVHRDSGWRCGGDASFHGEGAVS